MRNIFSTILFALSITAFGQKSGSTWKIQYVWEGTQMVNVLSKKTELLISIEEKKISGSIGCNTFQGNLEYIKGEKIKPIKIFDKKDDCEDKPDKLVKAIFDALKTSSKLVINQDLAKFYQGEKLILELKR
jgi:heat shock protein HslJ